MKLYILLYTYIFKSLNQVGAIKYQDILKLCYMKTQKNFNKVFNMLVKEISFTIFIVEVLNKVLLYLQLITTIQLIIEKLKNEYICINIDNTLYSIYFLSKIIIHFLFYKIVFLYFIKLIKHIISTIKLQIYIFKI